AIDTVRCAIEAQSGMAERHASLISEKRIESRVGLHPDAVVEWGECDLMDNSVDIAAPMQCLCEPPSGRWARNSARRSSISAKAMQEHGAPVPAHALRAVALTSSSISKFESDHAAWSSFVGPSVNDGMAIEVIHGGHDAVLELLFGCDADVAQDRAGELGEEALDEVEPGAVLGREDKFETADRLTGEPSLCLLGDVRGMIVEDQLDCRMGRI